MSLKVCQFQEVFLLGFPETCTASLILCPRNSYLEFKWHKNIVADNTQPLLSRSDGENVHHHSSIQWSSDIVRTDFHHMSVETTPQHNYTPSHNPSNGRTISQEHWLITNSVKSGIHIKAKQCMQLQTFYSNFIFPFTRLRDSSRLLGGSYHARRSRVYYGHVEACCYEWCVWSYQQAWNDESLKYVTGVCIMQVRAIRLHAHSFTQSISPALGD